jgi:hypothetical protein
MFVNLPFVLFCGTQFETPSLWIQWTAVGLCKVSVQTTLRLCSFHLVTGIWAQPWLIACQWTVLNGVPLLLTIVLSLLSDLKSEHLREWKLKSHAPFPANSQSIQPQVMALLNWMNCHVHGWCRGLALKDRKWSQFVILFSRTGHAHRKPVAWNRFHKTENYGLIEKSLF